MKSNSSDVLDYGPPPPAPGVGAKAVEGRRVRLMMTLPRYMVDPPIAYHEMTIADAIQTVQALRQAINDARRGIAK